MSGHLALYVPTAFRRVEPLHRHLGVGHGLPAAIERLPSARDERDGGVWQAAVGEFFLIQKTKDRLVH